jgi:tetratricopeptide (TPR) repeat protein
MDQSENSATIALLWEKLKIPFRVETNYVDDQLASFRQELRTEKGFIWQSWQQAALWCLQRNVNLEQALQWTDSATSTGFGGSKSFNAWSTKAQILEKLGRGAEAAEIMKRSLAFANMNEIHQYGRTLLQQKKNKEALNIFKMNFDKNPNQFTTLMGLARGYSASGDYKTALKHAQQALTVAPDTNNRNNVASLIEKLKEGKDIN